MTRDDARKAFIDRYLDETVGLLIRAFADCRVQLAEQNDQRIGRAMLQQMRDARKLLGRIFDDEHPEPKSEPKPVPETASTPARK